MKPTQPARNAEGKNSSSSNDNSKDSNSSNNNHKNDVNRQARASSINANQGRTNLSTPMAQDSSNRDEQSANTSGTSTTHTRDPVGVLTPIQPERPAGTPASARGGSRVKGRPAQRSQGPQGNRHLSHGPQQPPRVNSGGGQRGRTASHPRVSMRPGEANQAAVSSGEIKTEAQDPPGISAFPSVSSNTSHSQAMRRFGNPQDFSPYSRPQDRNRRHPSARPQAGFDDFPPQNPQNSFHPSPYQQSGAAMGFQHGGQYPQQYPYHPHPYGANGFSASSNPGQFPPQSGGAFSAQGGFGMNAAATPYDPPGFYYQPLQQPAPHGFPYPYGTANRRPDNANFTGYPNRYPGAAGQPQGNAISRPGSHYEDSEWLWPQHLSSRVRHARGSSPNEELRERAMGSPNGDIEEDTVNASPAASPGSVEIISISSRDEDEDNDDDGEPPRKKIRLSPTKTDNKSTGTNPVKKYRREHGQIQIRDDGSVWFRAYGAPEWEPTVRHEPNRAAMVTDARATGDYVVAPAGGPADVDSTSYLPAHREWFCNKPHDWHHPTMDDYLYRFQRGDLAERTDGGGPLRWRGSVVLNNDNLVMTDWPELPITLSSRIEGWRLELINRRDERSCAQDILDRMPSGPGGGHCMTASAIGNKRCRFRETTGLISWQHMEGTAAFYEAVRARLTPLQIAANSTKGFLGLGKQKLRELKEENRKKNDGASYKKAGKNLLTDEQRKAAARKPVRLNAAERFQEIEQSDESQLESQPHHPEPSTAAEAPTDNVQAEGEIEDEEYETGDEDHDADSVAQAEPLKTDDEASENENKEAGQGIEDEHHDSDEGDAYG